jgi:hypothetical protein
MALRGGVVGLALRNVKRTPREDWPILQIDRRTRAASHPPTVAARITTAYKLRQQPVRTPDP